MLCVWYIPACACNSAMCFSIFSASLSHQKNTAVATAAAVKRFPRVLTSHITCRWVVYSELLKRHNLLCFTFEENTGDAVGGWLIPRVLTYLIYDIHKHCGLLVSGLVWLFRNNTTAEFEKWNIFLNFPLVYIAVFCCAIKSWLVSLFPILSLGMWQPEK